MFSSISEARAQSQAGTEIELRIRARCMWCKALSAHTSTNGQTVLNGEEDAGSLAFAHNAHDVVRGSESSICSCASITLVQQLVMAATEVQSFSGWRYRMNDSFGLPTAFAKTDNVTIA
jgi:hypothetical protein